MRTLRTAAAFLILSGGAIAQSESRPEFEVASIKPAAPGSRGMFIRNSPGGRVNVTNMTLKELIVIAYRIQPFQISGGPSWFDSVHYDINAKAETTPKQGELPLMLQALLADRFQLTIQRETKDMPVYALVLAKKDGKLGPGLVESREGSCTAFDPAKPPPLPEPGQPRPNFCGNMMMQPRMLKASDIPVSQIVPMLSRFLGRTVIDKTGLTAKFDITLEWTPDESQIANMQLPPDVKPPPSDPAGPSIFTALQEQLGLKLEAQKGPVDIFVITRAEKPSEN
jgi:uncharacterized protein (TIGR03435 family)